MILFKRKATPRPGQCIAQAETLYTYSQVLVADVDGDFTGDAWQPANVERGVAVGRSVISFGFEGEGDLRVRVFWGPYAPNKIYEWAIAAPLEIITGKLTVCPPDEFPGKFRVDIPKGHYAVTAAICGREGLSQQLDLFMEPVTTPMPGAKLISGDEALRKAWK